MTKLGFLRTIQRPKQSQCNGNLHHLRGQRKRRKLDQNSKRWWLSFFYIRGIIMTKWVPSGQTVNQHYYVEVLAKLRKRIRWKRPLLWKNGSLHQDNAPVHNALSVKQFLANKNIPVLEHPPYSPNLAPCAFSFPQSKITTERYSFLIRRWGARKNDRDLEVFQKTIRNCVSKRGSAECTCVWTRKVTTLKEFTDFFVAFFNKERYRTSLVTFVSDLVLSYSYYY